jgi:hypothetical protein
MPRKEEFSDHGKKFISFILCAKERGVQRPWKEVLRE